MAQIAYANDNIALEEEPLLQNASNKYTIFPIKYHDIWDAFIDHKKAIWFVDHIDLTTDLRDWANLNDSEKHFVKHVLAFFAASDGIVMENLASRFCNEIQIAEARSFYAVQMMMENEHSIMYSRLIETYINDKHEKEQLFNAIEHIPAISKKARWAEKWINSSESFATRLVAFAIVEGIFFSGSFCCIFWLSEKGIMPGLCKSNRYIAIDEAKHCDFAIMLYNKYIKNKLTQEKLHHIIDEAVEIEKEFITESLSCALLGMNATLMSQYIEFVANRLVKQLGHQPIFEHARQPFPFMDRIALQSQTNFFDGRETNYQLSVSSNPTEQKELVFDADF